MSKYLDIQAWANSVDSDYMLQNGHSAAYSLSLHCLLRQIHWSPSWDKSKFWLGKWLFISLAQKKCIAYTFVQGIL